jgi:hypothetical protein
MHQPRGSTPVQTPSHRTATPRPAAADGRRTGRSHPGAALSLTSRTPGFDLNLEVANGVESGRPISIGPARGPPMRRHGSPRRGRVPRCGGGGPQPHPDGHRLIAAIFATGRRPGRGDASFHVACRAELAIRLAANDLTEGRPSPRPRSRPSSAWRTASSDRHRRRTPMLPRSTTLAIPPPVADGAGDGPSGPPGGRESQVGHDGRREPGDMEQQGVGARRASPGGCPSGIRPPTGPVAVQRPQDARRPAGSPAPVRSRSGSTGSGGPVRGRGPC